MPLPVKTGFPLALELPDGYQLQWRAVDPTTGADVSGVVVSTIAIQGEPVNVPPGTALQPVYEMPGLTGA